MGWWSAAIMGGDGPCDYEADMLDDVGIGGSFFDRFQGPFTAKNIKPIQKKFTPGRLNLIVDRLLDGEFYETNIAWQVFGVLLMRFGIVMPDVIKGQILEACLEDEWAMDDDERLDNILSYINDLLAYDGKTPTELSDADEGLFAAITVAMSTKQSGLINK